MKKTSIILVIAFIFIFLSASFAFADHAETEIKDVKEEFLEWYLTTNRNARWTHYQAAMDKIMETAAPEEVPEGTVVYTNPEMEEQMQNAMEEYYSGLSGIASEKLIEQMARNRMPMSDDEMYMEYGVFMSFVDVTFGEGKEDTFVNGLIYDFDARVTADGYEVIPVYAYTSDEEGCFHITGQITVDDGIITNIYFAAPAGGNVNARVYEPDMLLESGWYVDSVTVTPDKIKIICRYPEYFSPQGDEGYVCGFFQGYLLSDGTRIDCIADISAWTYQLQQNQVYYIQIANLQEPVDPETIEAVYMKVWDQEKQDFSDTEDLILLKNINYSLLFDDFDKNDLNENEYICCIEDIKFKIQVYDDYFYGYTFYPDTPAEDVSLVVNEFSEGLLNTIMEDMKTERTTTGEKQAMVDSKDIYDQAFWKYINSISVSAPAIEMTEDHDPSFLNTLVNEAIVVLAESWNDYCWDSNNPDNEYILDIRSTRVICIKDAFDEAQEEPFLRAQEELFGNVQYVIEFLTYADYMANSIYTYPMIYDVIIYDDGNMEWARMGNYIDEYRGRTFSNDFSAFIDRVIDLHEEYNQVIRFQNHEIFFEEVLE